MQNRIYTVIVEAGNEDGTAWQSMEPSETVTTFNGETAQQVAEFTAANQSVADGFRWRVRVWEGHDADLSTPVEWYPDLWGSYARG